MESATVQDFGEFIKGPLGEKLSPELLERVSRLWADHQDLLRSAGLRRQIDLYLCRSQDPEHVAALMLTVITAGELFGYNRAILLLRGLDGHLREAFGIGPVDREEALSRWRHIQEEKLGFEDLVRRALDDFLQENQRLAPILDRFGFTFGTEDPLTAGLSGPEPAVVSRASLGGEGEWLFDLLSTDLLGFLPLWGQRGHFGTIIVDNFVTRKGITGGDLLDLSAFIQPFASFLERSIIIEQYETKVQELTAAHEKIEAQRETILNMEKRMLMNRYSAVLAHNVKNPIISMMGNLKLLKEHRHDPSACVEFTEAIASDLAALEDFAEDFISQVEESYPSRHFWDLNHLVRETLRLFRETCPMESTAVRLTEGELPLVFLDYDLTRSILLRLLGIILAERPRGMQVEVTTALGDGLVQVLIGGGDAITPADAFPGQWDRIVGRLAAEGITLRHEEGRMVVQFPLNKAEGREYAQDSRGR